MSIVCAVLYNTPNEELERYLILHILTVSRGQNIKFKFIEIFVR